MCEHTPGPWTIDAEDLLQDEDTVFSIGIWSGEGDTRTMIANVTAFNLHSEYCDGIEYVTTAPAERSKLDTATANARLIAAAPSLLNTLQEVHSWIVCGAIASAEDLAQSFPHIEQIISSALAGAVGAAT